MNPETPSRTNAFFDSLKTFCGRELLFVDKPRMEPSGALLQLREWLSENRAGRRSGYMNEEAFLKAYCSYYLPVHLPEAYWILTQVIAKGYALRPVKRLLDLGCGPGTATLSYLLFCDHNGVVPPEDIHLVDSSKAALALAHDLALVLAPNARVHLHRIDLRNTRQLSEITRKLGRTMDLVLMSHLLNEFGSGPRSRESKSEFIDRALLSFCQEHGHLLLLEPPLRSPTMDLMSLRDELTEKGAKIIAPCPAGTTHCPMLRASAGWCYAQPPREQIREQGIAPWDKAIGRLLDIELSHPGFSYLLIGMQPEEKPPRHTAIGISDAGTDMICVGKAIKHSPTPYRGAYLEKAFAASDESPNPPKKPSVR